MIRFERRVILWDDLSRYGATVREKISKQKLKSLRKKPRTTSIIFIPVHDFFQMTQLKAVKIEQREREKRWSSNKTVKQDFEQKRTSERTSGVSKMKKERPPQTAE